MFNEDLYKLLEKNVDSIKSKISLFNDIDESELLRKCNFNKYKLNALNKAKSSPSAFAVFGESQVGKSFLISELIGGENAKLNIKDFEDKDFISLNDSHSGGETTALVTRLTKIVDPNVPPGYAKIKLMKIEDLIWSTANGFYSELMGYNLELPSNIDSVIKDYINNIQNVLDSQTGTKLGEIMSTNIINAYVNCVNNLQSLYQNNAVIENVVKVKDFITSSENQNKITNLSIDSIEAIIKTIWMDNKILNDYFSVQLKLLNHIDYQEDLYLHHDNIKSILNVGDDMLDLNSTALDNFPKIENLKIQLDDKDKSNISKRLLQLIIKEVVIPIKSNSKILSTIDILDFPGARSMGQEGVDLNNITSHNWMEMFKRGKIKYFFNHYVEIHEITYLLLALSLESQPNVKNLPSMIKEWKDALGKEINNKLFITLTKSDVLLNNKSTKEQFVDMINKKMKAFTSFYDSINLNDWNNSGKPFSDYYFVRNPMADNRGYNKKGQLNPEYEETFNHLLNAFKNSEELTKIFNPKELEDVFNKTYSPPDNGIPNLIDNLLLKIGKNPSEAKYNYLNKNLEQIHNGLLDLLKANGVIPLDKREEQNLQEIKELVNTLKGREYMNLVNFLETFIDSFPDSQTLHNIVLSNQSSESIWGDNNNDTMLATIEEFISNWFRYKIDRSQLSECSKIEPHILKNYLKYMKNAIIEKIENENLDDFKEFLSETSENNSQILAMVLKWKCGQFFTYLGDDLEYKNPELINIPKSKIMPVRILDIWASKLAPIYSGKSTGEAVSDANNNEELLAIYSELN